MKGAIEYLRALRDICAKSNLNCDACPLMDIKEFGDLSSCPMMTSPNAWSDEDILKMVKMVGRIADGTRD